jgi:hypothetical protein
MRYNPEMAADDWELLEIVTGAKRPCSDAYARANTDDLVQIFRELRLLKAAGCPPNRLRGNPEVEIWKGRCPGAHKACTFFVLKAKPSGWRLYFWLKDSQNRQLVFLYAVNKKRNDRNQEDFNRLCHTRDRVGRSGVRLERIYIPRR